jgi:hypothetical protein
VWRVKLFASSCLTKEIYKLYGSILENIILLYYFKHDEHDILFGGKKIYIACAASWIIAFLTLLPDILGVMKQILAFFSYIYFKQKTGSYGWTGSVYGCDSVNSTAECSNIGPLLNQIINLCAVIGFYTAVMWHLFRQRKEVV